MWLQDPKGQSLGAGEGQKTGPALLVNNTTHSPTGVGKITLVTREEQLLSRSQAICLLAPSPLFCKAAAITGPCVWDGAPSGSAKAYS